MKQKIETKPNTKDYLTKTELLDFESDLIQNLVKTRNWKNLSDTEKVKQIYNFVKDEIKFGYNLDDAIPATQVLKDGYGQCNTKANLFMALLRAVHIPNRMHGFTIDKALQKGAITGIWYKLSPANILHSWVEVYLNNQWFNLEGLILDQAYLNALQQKFPDCKTTFCGYGAYTENFQKPAVEWSLNHTYIQDKGINQDFGLFNSPDEFYQKHQQQLNPIKRWMFRNLVRHLMNKNVAAIRNAFS